MARSASVPPETSRHGTPSIVAGRYRLDTPIGRGGAGVVWRGEDELLQRLVAVKEILAPLAGAQNERDAIRARVLREARALARLHSPSIVSVYDVVEEAERHWIVMELVDADSLGDVIRNHGPLSPGQAAAIGVALIDALRTAHSAGVLHRDVKPGNVLLGRDGRVRLTDFGIAATEGDVTLTGTGALVGSPAYIAPERVRGSSGSPASDLWGLGATLYSAVEGSPPYEGPETYAVLTAVVEGRRRPFRNAGPLRSLLTDLLDKPAEERPDADEIRQRLIPVARNTQPVPDSVLNGRSLTSNEPAQEQASNGNAGDVLENVVDETPVKHPPESVDRHEAHTQLGLEGVPDPAVRAGDTPLSEAGAGFAASMTAVEFSNTDSDELAGLMPVTEEHDLAGVGRPNRPADPGRRPLAIAAAAGAVVVAAAIAASVLLSGGGSADLPDQRTADATQSATPTATTQTLPATDAPVQPNPIVVPSRRPYATRSSLSPSATATAPPLTPAPTTAAPTTPPPTSKPTGGASSTPSAPPTTTAATPTFPLPTP